MPRLHLRVITRAIVLGTLLAFPGQAAASYDGHSGRLFFGLRTADNVDVHSVRPGGQALHRLTTDPGFDACPALSADGRSVAFCSDRTGAFEIWTMKANGTRQRQITRLGGFSIFPDWSPDGSQIALTANAPGEPDETEDIWVVGANGHGLRRLTDTPDHGDAFPVWSPDGSRILFVSNRTGLPQLWVMDADGSDERQLTFDPAVKDQVPDWHPGGLRIAYAADGDIWVADADGTDARRFQTDDFEFGPAWSPDGRRIGFLRESPFGRLLMTMRPDGDDVRTLELPGSALVPAWQPLGRGR